MIRTAGVT